MIVIFEKAWENSSAAEAGQVQSAQMWGRQWV
jgi:hypothetical protein